MKKIQSMEIIQKDDQKQDEVKLEEEKKEGNPILDGIEDDDYNVRSLSSNSLSFHVILF